MSIAKEFREFAVKGNVMDLAVGVIIGAAFGKIVGSLVEDVVMPVVGALLGGLDFSGLAVKIGIGDAQVRQVPADLPRLPDHRLGDLQGEAAEIESAQQRAHHRHHHVLDQRAHDPAEGSADDHAHRQVHDVALDREFAEFLSHAHGLRSDQVFLVYRVVMHIENFKRLRAAGGLQRHALARVRLEQRLGDRRNPRHAPRAESTSSTPTMVMVFSPPAAFRRTVAPETPGRCRVPPHPPLRRLPGA